VADVLGKFLAGFGQMVNGFCLTAAADNRSTHKNSLVRVKANPDEKGIDCCASAV
jgi:hypothetical protein